MQPQGNLPRSCRMKIFFEKATLKILFSKSKGNCHKKLCLAAHKLFLLKSCYEECLSCVITILVVYISAPLAIKPAPDTVPSMVILSKNACSSKQSDHLFSIYRHKNIRINYTNPFCLDKMLRKYLRLQNNVLHHQCILFQLHISVLIPSYQKNV